MRVAVIGLLCCMISPPSGSAQSVAEFPRWAPARETPTAVRVVPDDSTADFGGMVLAGTMGSVVGAYVGGSIGYQLDIAGGCTGDWCGLGGAFLGALAGSSLLAGVGVHAVNDSRGSLATGVLGAALGALGGFSLAAATDEPVSILFLPFLQAGAAAIAERATTPRDPRRQEDP